MFKRVLVANRGEVAVRVLRTLRRLGIEGVAVYAEDDKTLPHVRLADVRAPLGAGAASATYLDMDKIIEAAVQSGAEAVHPGYGFLSENASFARRVADAGLVFVGPPPATIEVMGDKTQALALARKAGVPVTPGSPGPVASPEAVAKVADEIGFPILLKASHGGGGMGMVRVETAEEIPGAFERATRQAASAFGRPEVFVERYWTRARHIEIQMVFDAEGHGLHLGERECSIQRRHQKLVEEAPSPGMAPELREKMGTAALELAASAGFTNVGTAEFLLVDDKEGRFVFNEVNPRLQVEHPVTEMVTGVDIVELQLRAAAGEPLGLAGAPRLNGHAIEVRINAEDPLYGFRPSPGTVEAWEPPRTEGLRIDHMLSPGLQVPASYDSLIAKVIAWGPERHIARWRLRQGLDRIVLRGFPTNRAFQRYIVDHPAFARADLSTRFLDEHGILGGFKERMAREAAAVLAARTPDLKGLPERGEVRYEGHRLPFSVNPTGLSVADIEFRSIICPEPGGAEVSLDGHMHVVRFATGRVILDGREVAVDFRGALPERRAGLGPSTARTPVTPPMPGRIVKVHVTRGAEVGEGQPVIVLEAMKMQSDLLAPHSGVVEEVHVKEGDQVATEDVLLVIGPKRA